MTSLHDPWPAARRGLTGFLSAAISVSVAACAATTAGAPGPSTAAPSMAALRVLQQQAFIDAPQAYRVVPAFGSLWVDQVASYDNEQKATWVVSRIDPKTNTVVASIPFSQTTDGIAATDTSLWVMDGDAQAIREVDPATNRPTGRKVGVNDEGGNVLFANGQLWHVGWGAITRIDPATGTATPLSGPLQGGCEGGCGAVVASDAIYTIRDGVLTRYSLDGDKVLAKNETDVAGTALAIGKDGVYVGSSTGSVAILDPATLQLKQVITATPVTDSGGTKWSLGSPGNGDIVADDTGAWVRFSPGIVGRIDPVAGTITLYGGPFPSEVMAGGASDIAVADGSLWVTNVGEGSGGLDGGKPGVYRLALPTP